MRYFYDLHIHTALSPCADVLMSPNNILNMSFLKELHIIAITDHNSCLQLDVIEELKDSYEMLIVPGAEIEVKEKYHVVCLFKTFDIARKFQKALNVYLDKKMHNEEIYGEQNLFDAFDDIISNYQVSLMGSSNISLKDLGKIVKGLDGLLILAHIEKYGEDIFDKLENEYQNIFDAIEVNASYDINKIKDKINKFSYLVLRNSDAHQITDISEPINSIELEDLSIESLFKAIRKR